MTADKTAGSRDSAPPPPNDRHVRTPPDYARKQLITSNFIVGNGRNLRYRRAPLTKSFAITILRSSSDSLNNSAFFDKSVFRLMLNSGNVVGHWLMRFYFEIEFFAAQTRFVVFEKKIGYSLKFNSDPRIQVTDKRFKWWMMTGGSSRLGNLYNFIDEIDFDFSM